ncbi:MAG TPA: hypothetical protein VHK27_07205 [Gammaproteobacteria bacterium]|nr:hypothetical protein [Gammaproteobacteria bacterium]
MSTTSAAAGQRLRLLRLLSYCFALKFGYDLRGLLMLLDVLVYRALGLRTALHAWQIACAYQQDLAPFAKA